LGWSVRSKVPLTCTFCTKSRSTSNLPDPLLSSFVGSTRSCSGHVSLATSVHELDISQSVPVNSFARCVLLGGSGRLDPIRSCQRYHSLPSPLNALDGYSFWRAIQSDWILSDHVRSTTTFPSMLNALGDLFWRAVQLDCGHLCSALFVRKSDASQPSWIKTLDSFAFWRFGQDATITTPHSLVLK
jgi:hypothetical protein